MAGKLEDKVAVITGSDSGIGHAMAEAFAEEGADVAITYFKDKNGAEQAREKVERAGRRAIMVNIDQRDPKQVEKLFRETEQKLGTPYVLVNDAGIDSTGKQVADMPIEDWDNEMKTNLYGPFYCCQHFIRPRRVERRDDTVNAIVVVRHRRMAHVHPPYIRHGWIDGG